MRLVVLVAAGATLLSGCAVSGQSGQPCATGIRLTADPQSGTADHAANAPGNQVKFNAVVSPTVSGAGCAVPQWVMLAQAQWTSSDPTTVQVSSAQDQTNGTATCLKATSAPVTLTANFTMSSESTSGTATITCQ